MKTLLKGVGVTAIVVVVTGVTLFVYSKPAGDNPDNETEIPAPDDELRARAGLPVENLQDAWKDYRTARDDRDDDELAGALARRLASAALDGADASDLADITLELHDDGHREIAHPMLDPAWQRMRDEDIIFKRTLTRTEGLRGPPPKPDPRFVRIVELLGWTEYHHPEGMDDAERYDVEGASAYREYLGFEIDNVCHESGLYPPEVVERLNELAGKALGRFNELKARHERDGYALNARAAWIRFRHANDSVAKVDRVKGQRSFSPRAMGRQNENFDGIWTFTYWKPFVVYIEKPHDTDVDETFKNEVAALLRRLHDWFRENYIEPMDLERQRPQYDARRAEEEGWPIEIVLFGRRESLDQYIEDIGGDVLQGGDGFYSPLEGRVLSYLQPWRGRDEDLSYRASLVKSVFLMLCDHYAADPHFSVDEMMARPRYSSLLIREGLGETVAGLTREGRGAQTDYTFMEINRPRLEAFLQHDELLGERALFRIRDMVKCTNHTRLRQVAYRRALDLGGMRPPAAAASAEALFIPAAWSAVHFFENYQRNGEYVYRKPWREFVRRDFTGELRPASHADEKGGEVFSELFDIRGDADWDELEQEWLTYVRKLGEPTDD